MSNNEVKYLADGTHAIFAREVNPDYDYRRARELMIIQLLATLILDKREWNEIQSFKCPR